LGTLSASSAAVGRWAEVSGGVPTWIGCEPTRAGAAVRAGSARPVDMDPRRAPAEIEAAPVGEL